MGPWERFRVEYRADGTLAVRSRTTGRYVCAEDAGAAPLIADRTAVGPWETFTVTVLR